MKIAIVGSRDCIIEDPDAYIPACDEIVSGGAKGVDTCAAEFARRNGIRLTEFLPRYDLYGRAAPIVRNRQIVDYADRILIFWNGISRGTLSVIRYAEKQKKEYRVILCGDSQNGSPPETNT